MKKTRLLDSQFRVCLPKEFVKEIGASCGDVVEVSVYGDSLILKKHDATDKLLYIAENLKKVILSSNKKDCQILLDKFIEIEEILYKKIDEENYLY